MQASNTFERHRRAESCAKYFSLVRYLCLQSQGIDRLTHALVEPMTIKLDRQVQAGKALKTLHKTYKIL